MAGVLVSWLGTRRHIARLIAATLLVVLVSQAGISRGSTARQDESEKIDRLRGMLHDRGFLRLPPGSTHLDSLRALRYELLVRPGRAAEDCPENPVCIALIEVLSVAPRNDSLAIGYETWDAGHQSTLKMASLVTIRALEAFGCRGLELEPGPVSIHTVCSTPQGVILEGGHPAPVLFPGVRAYVAIEHVAALGGMPMLRPLFCLGEPGDSSSLAHLDGRIRPLVEEIGKAVEETSIGGQE